MSRFDLLFVLLDTMDAENDQRISEHVVRMHRYRNPNEADGEAMPLKNDADFLSTEDPNAGAENHQLEVCSRQCKGIVGGMNLSFGDFSTASGKIRVMWCVVIPNWEALFC